MPRWSCQFFLTADNDLFKVVEDGLTQFQKVNPNNVNVVVQLDTPRERTKRLVLDQDGRFPVLPAKVGMRTNRNAGDPQTLVNFLFASKHLRPGQCTMLVIGGHGTGIADLTKIERRKIRQNWRVEWTGSSKPGAMALGTDDSSHDFLDNNELEAALLAFRDRTRRGFRKPEIIGCDACLMGTVEMAHQLREHARYFIASQDNEPAKGWPHAEILKTFHNGVHPVRAAINVVNAYGEAHKKDPAMTLSAVDLHRMDGMAAALNHLGDALMPFVKRDIRTLAHAREEARAFANFDSIDLYGYVEALERPFRQSRRTLADAAVAVLHNLRDAVIATSKKPEISGAHGLSVYLPNFPVIDAYHRLSLSEAAPRWHQFVVAYGANRHLI